MNGKWMGDLKGSWTAISRTPYLKAIGLWANGSCWNGGGLFTTNSDYWLNSFVCGHEAKQVPGELEEQKEFPFHENYGGECPGVYYIRLQRDGWKLIRHAKAGSDDGYSVFQKPLPLGWYLEKTAHATIDRPVGKGCYYDTHRLVQPDRDLALDFPDWEWADFDRRRLVWSERGLLRAAALMRNGPDFMKDLCDFNDMSFKPIRAPY